MNIFSIYGHHKTSSCICVVGNIARPTLQRLQANRGDATSRTRIVREGLPFTTSSGINWEEESDEISGTLQQFRLLSVRK